MGKVIVYKCDYCLETYKYPSEVMSVDGVILDGNDDVIYEGDRLKLICGKCLLSKLELGEEIKEEEIFDDEREELNETPKEIQVLKKISTEKEESEFIGYIGHITRDSFNSVYNKSMLNHYYPIVLEENEIIEPNLFTKSRTVDVIHKVFASIPQVKKMVVLLNESENRAIADLNLFDE